MEKSTHTLYSSYDSDRETRELSEQRIVVSMLRELDTAVACGWWRGGELEQQKKEMEVNTGKITTWEREQEREREGESESTSFA